MPVNSVAQLKKTFAGFAADGAVSADEAQKLVELVKDGAGVTASERRQLRDLFTARGDTFDADASARLKKFIETEVDALIVDDVRVVGNGDDKKDLADPAVLKSDRHVVYEWANGALFKDGATAADVMQGQLGDCFAVSGLAAIAAANPGVIEDAITDHGDGTYTVSLFDPDSVGASTEKIEVVVDGQLPTKNGGLVYGRNRDRSELWVAIIEKAFAQVLGSYDKLHEGGKPSWVMHALTGRSTSATDLSVMDEDMLFWVLEEGFKRGHSGAITTHGHDQTALYSGTGMYAEHGYSVMGVGERDGKRFVTLRNPWGEVEPAGHGRDDGIFDIDLPTLMKLGSHLFLV